MAASTSRRFSERICSSITRAIGPIIDRLQQPPENPRVIRPSSPFVPPCILFLAAFLLTLLPLTSPASAQTLPEALPQSLAQSPTLDKAGEAVSETAQKAAEAAADAAQRAAEAAQTQFHQDPIFWSYVIAAIAAIACIIGFDIARAGSLERAGKRSISSVPGYVWFGSAILCYLFSSLAQFGALELPLGLSATATDNRNIALLTLSGFLGGALSAIIISRALSIAEPNAGLSITQRCLVQGALGLLLAFPLVNLANILLALLHKSFGGTVEPLGHQTLRALSENPQSVWPWVSAACAIILAPVFEELVFRGMLQTALLRAFNRPWLAIFLTSALFAAMHTVGSIQMPWYGIASIFILSISMGIAFERTKRIGVPIVMHVLFNAANVAITLLIT